MTIIGLEEALDFAECIQRNILVPELDLNEIFFYIATDLQLPYLDARYGGGSVLAKLMNGEQPT